MVFPSQCLCGIIRAAWGVDSAPVPGDPGGGSQTGPFVYSLLSCCACNLGSGSQFHLRQYW